MNNSAIPRPLPFASLFTITFGLVLCLRAGAATLDDFGYQNMKVNGNPAIGARPTLVILLDLANTGSFAHNNAYYDNLVFNPFTTTSAGLRSVNGFMLVNSHARFSLTRVGPGLIGPLQLPADQRAKALTNDFMRAGFAITAAVNSGVNFAPYDNDGDGRITADEALVLIFDNINPKPDGASRWANPNGVNGAGFTPAGSAVSFSMSVGLAAQQVGFATLCHEFSHVLSTRDIYGANCFNYRYTLMSCTITGADDMFSCGLDAWHKLQLGWVDPRIRSLSAGGVETVAAAQSLTATDAPVILYDPARGTREFFLVEYRTSTSPGGAGYEDDVPSNGLGIWHIVHDANNNLIQLPWGTNLWNQTVWLEGQPNLQRGGDTNMLWTSGTTTPFLTWSDGTVTPTRIAVRPFNTGDGSITFEWLTASDTWVDFNSPGFPFFPETGTFVFPFNTVAEGVASASHGGTLHLKSATSSERPTITKPLLLVAEGGPVTIGQ